MKISTPTAFVKKLSVPFAIGLLVVSPGLAETSQKTPSPAPVTEKQPGMLKKLWPFGKKQTETAPPSKSQETVPAKRSETAKTTAPAANTKKTPPQKAPDTSPATEQSKSGMLGKLWPFGKKAEPAAPKLEAAQGKPAQKPGAKPEVAKKAAPSAESTPTKPESAGLMSRLWPFGGKEKEQTAPAPAAPKNPGTTKTAEALKNIAKEETPKESGAESKKSGGFFSRLFGGGEDTDSSSESGDFSPREKPVRPDDWEEKAWITENDTAGYLIGPAQASPDIRLAKGTLVTMKKRGRDWTDIILEDGRTMTVAADQVRKALKEDFADPAPPIVMGPLPPLPNYQPIPETNLPSHEPELLPGTGELLLLPIPTEGKP